MCSPVDNKYSYTDRDIAETLNSFFTSVSKVNDENAILPNFIAKTGSILHSVNVTSDLISHKMLKGAAKAVSKPLTILFNRSLDESIFPDTWKIPNVIHVPIYKKGLASDPSNYRPISLLCYTGKLLERLVFKDIYNYLHENDNLYKYQSGFVPNHSTTFQLIDIYHQICRTFENHQYSCMVFFDISKAFDRVWHKGLLFKLKQNGINGKLLFQIFQMDFKLFVKQKAESYSKLKLLFSTSSHSRSTSRICVRTAFIFYICK